ncbi:hypothetical protein [Variovorax sp. GB1P17]|uniref:hypothetical protein n=1 Tax=Variovorax sp. GB1P17 TaxID=3443740 RepID=UPI003F484DBB
MSFAQGTLLVNRRSTTALSSARADTGLFFAKSRRSEAGDIREKEHRVGVSAALKKGSAKNNAPTAQSDERKNRLSS